MEMETKEQNNFMEKLENLMTAIEIYRDVENKAIARIQELLKEKGIEISESEIKTADKDSIRERLRATKTARVQEEYVAEESSYETKDVKNWEEERSCRR